jgi:hypothetical protein
MATSYWAKSIARVEIQQFATRIKALDAEKMAIKTEHPLHNKMHNTHATGKYNTDFYKPNWFDCTDYSIYLNDHDLYRRHSDFFFQTGYFCKLWGINKAKIDNLCKIYLCFDLDLKYRMSDAHNEATLEQVNMCFEDGDYSDLCAQYPELNDSVLIAFVMWFEEILLSQYKRIKIIFNDDYEPISFKDVVMAAIIGSSRYNSCLQREGYPYSLEFFDWFAPEQIKELNELADYYNF